MPNRIGSFAPCRHRQRRRVNGICSFLRAVSVLSLSVDTHGNGKYATTVKETKLCGAGKYSADSYVVATVLIFSGEEYVSGPGEEYKQLRDGNIGACQTFPGIAPVALNGVATLPRLDRLLLFFLHAHLRNRTNRRFSHSSLQLKVCPLKEARLLRLP